MFTHQTRAGDTVTSDMSPICIPSRLGGVCRHHPHPPAISHALPPSLRAGCRLGHQCCQALGSTKKSKSQQRLSTAAAAHSCRGLIRMQSIRYFCPAYGKKLSDASLIPGIINLPQLPDSRLSHVSRLCVRKALCMQIIYLSSI